MEMKMVLVGEAWRRQTPDELSRELELEEREERPLLSPEAAAALLGCSLEAFRARVRRGQVPGVVRTGRKVQVHKNVLLASLESKARRAR